MVLCPHVCPVCVACIMDHARLNGSDAGSCARNAGYGSHAGRTRGQSTSVRLRRSRCPEWIVVCLTPGSHAEPHKALEPDQR